MERQVRHVAGKPKPTHRHFPRHVAAVVRCRDLLRRSRQRIDLRPQADLRHLGLLLQPARQRILILGPDRHADGVDITLDHFGNRLVQPHRPHRGADIDGQFAVRHHRRALRDLLRALEQNARTLGGRIAEVPPAGSDRGNDVRL